MSVTDHDVVAVRRLREARLVRENYLLRQALAVPSVWSEEERDGLAAAYDRATARHGHYESLFAAAAFLLRHRAAAFERQLADAPTEG